MRIDSHQHFWQISRGDYRWMTPDLPDLLRQDYLPSQLHPLLKSHQIDKTVLVQAADTTAETDYLLSLAQREPFIAGVVGWLDVESNNFAKQLANYRRNPRFTGVRPMLQYLADDYILRPRVLAALRHLAAEEFPLDILIVARQLPNFLLALEQLPNLRAVIDHIAKPNIKSREWTPWATHVAQAATFPHVYCKLSGMITEADHALWADSDLRPYVEHVFKSFGPKRVMFGSDWPVCLMAGSYDRVLGAVETILRPLLSSEAEADFFGGNAAQFYRLT